VEFRRRVLAFYSAQAARPPRSEGH